MLIRMTVSLAGGINLAPGDEHEFEQAEAVRLIEAGFAVPVEPDIERAVPKRVKVERRA